MLSLAGKEKLKYNLKVFIQSIENPQCRIPFHKNALASMLCGTEMEGKIKG